jgi:hypothetical protein
MIAYPMFQVYNSQRSQTGLKIGHRKKIVDTVDEAAFCTVQYGVRRLVQKCIVGVGDVLLTCDPVLEIKKLNQAKEKAACEPYARPK